MLSNEAVRANLNHLPVVPSHLLSLGNVKISMPRKYVLLVTMSRPKALNVFTEEMEDEMRQVMEWAEADNGIWYALNRPHCHHPTDPNTLPTLLLG